MNGTARKERKLVAALLDGSRDSNVVLSGRPSLDLTVGGHKEVESRRDWDQTGLNRNGQEPATEQVQQGHLCDGQSDIFKEMESQRVWEHLG